MLRRFVAVAPLGALIGSQMLLSRDYIRMEQKKPAFPVLPPGHSPRFDEMVKLVCGFQDSISQVGCCRRCLP